MKRVYLDHNATTPLRREARAAMVAAMDQVGNPSSVHAEGRAAKAIVEQARAQVAQTVGCEPAEVVFTSGATEAARVLQVPVPEHHVYVDPTAHDALLAHAGGVGAGATTATLAMGLANSETGVISAMPQRAEGKWCSGAQRADWLLLDITQAAGRIPVDFAASKADFAILSAHKLGGPKGVGALVVRQGLDITALAPGGGQEMGRRSGTENIIGIAGFGAAAAAAARDIASGRWEEVKELRKILENTLAASAKTTIFVGKDSDRLPNTSCFAMPGWKGESQVIQMDLAGFAISAGSACSSGKVRESHVLRAMGYDEETASSAIRVSLGLETTAEDVQRFAETWLAKERNFRARMA
ncbi:cysteine desulfurase [Roseobacter sp. YSTF-M11]|uniref:Cysteine desulfurase n=1 Tax=Roseobacter insulae TaxID=2859783 RepID=A0A9X1FVN8_9RHOB|nr:cysteine desulfurase family protein [Roseobacter insulae]MBW4708890.1 cysteine desulfurase [Roseobacter insulae]